MADRDGDDGGGSGAEDGAGGSPDPAGESVPNPERDRDPPVPPGPGTPPPAAREGWAATLEDMRATAVELEANGYEVRQIRAGSTTGLAPDGGAAAVDPSNPAAAAFGLVYVVPGEDADALAALDPAALDGAQVYRSTAGGTLFLLTVLFAGDRAVLLAGATALDDVADCARAARKAERMYTRVRRLDGETVLVAEHGSHEPFFPVD